MKKFLLGAVGVILTPILLTIFILDRLIMSFLFWTKFDNLNKWLENHEGILISIIRVIVVLAIYTLINVWL